MNLSTPIEQLPRVGPQYQKKLKKLGIKTIGDLLFHFPHRYEDFSNIISISEINSVRKTEKSSSPQPSLLKFSKKMNFNESCCVQGKVLEIKNNRIWKKKMVLTQALIQDNSGTIKVIWFNQPYLINVLKENDVVCLAGKLASGKNGVYLSSPVYEKIQPSTFNIQRSGLTHTGRIVPVYPETEGLSSRWLRYIIKPLLIEFKERIPDSLPETIREEENLLVLSRALWQVHFPDSMALAEKALKRFSFENLFLIEVFLLRERMKLAREKAVSVPLNLKVVQRFINSLPFKLTASQKKSAWRILKDLEKPKPMNRLLEGDVGSGKTVVAAVAALNAVKAGYQVVLMAPTEILAKQHFQNITKLLEKFNLNIGLLTGKEDKFTSKKLKSEVIEISRGKLLEKVEKGEINILIGTHALIQGKAQSVSKTKKGVKFGNLALVILDEQHRFGVEQRARLCRNYGEQAKLIPHLLSMTATPIPRTLALTIYGDLDLSLITELPKGRKKIITKVVPPGKREEAYGFIRKEVKKGRKVFVICPRIEKVQNKKRKGEGEKEDIFGWTEVKTVKEEYEKLSKKIFPNLKVGMLHGKMTTKEKERIMKRFKNSLRSKQKIDILVSTSVVEVGIDIPEATVMMIEGAERFGLAQLHQFRGRVGRALFQSFCFLFTDSPAKKTKLRLQALIACENGFELAEKDLKIRGPGDFSGTRQWGIPDLIMNSLTDIFLVEKTRKAAREILENDPKLKKYPLLQKRIEGLREKVHLE